MSPSATYDTSAILKAICEESLGFKFGEPDRPSKSSLACILPILRDTSQQRQYLTYPETDRVIVSDSGSISKLTVENGAKDNVFLRAGTIFDGKGTQSRTLTRSAVIFPGTKVSLDVRCVHQSHGIRTGSNFAYGGVTPLNVEKSFYGAGFTPRDQGTMWNNVHAESVMMNSLLRGGGTTTAAVPDSFTTYGEEQTYGEERPIRSSGTQQRRMRSNVRASAFTASAGAATVTPPLDNLKANYDRFAANFDDVLSKARLHDNQTGIALITTDGCQTVELFDLPASWEAIHKDAVRRMGTELLRGPDNTNVFAYKPENAANAVKQVLSLDFKQNLIYEHKPSNGEPGVKIIGLTAAKYLGEAVEIDGRVMHLTVFSV